MRKIIFAATFILLKYVALSQDTISPKPFIKYSTGEVQIFDSIRIKKGDAVGNAQLILNGGKPVSVKDLLFVKVNDTSFYCKVEKKRLARKVAVSKSNTWTLYELKQMAGGGGGGGKTSFGYGSNGTFGAQSTFSGAGYGGAGGLIYSYYFADKNGLAKKTNVTELCKIMGDDKTAFAYISRAQQCRTISLLSFATAYGIPQILIFTGTRLKNPNALIYTSLCFLTGGLINGIIYNVKRKRNLYAAIDSYWKYETKVIQKKKKNQTN